MKVRVTMRSVFCAVIVLWAVGPADVRAQDDLAPPSEVIADTTFGTVDYDLVLKKLDGSTVKLSNFRGRVLLINFWASWCAPCIKEMPSIDALRQRLASDGVEVMMVSVDDDPADVRAFVNKYGPDWPVYLRSWDRAEPPFRSALLPRTYIVSKGGEVVYEHKGAANWNSDTVADFLQKLAKE